MILAANDADGLLGLGWLDWTVLAIYFVVVVGIGLWSMKKVKNMADFFMGGRRFGKVFMMFFAFGSGTSSEQAVSVVAGTWRAGLAGIWWQFLWLWATPFYWIVAPVMRRMRALTTSDFFEARYGPLTATLYSAFGIITSIVFIAAGLYGSGIMVNELTGGKLDEAAHEMNITLPEVEAKGETRWFQPGKLMDVATSLKGELDKGGKVPGTIKKRFSENADFNRKHRPLSDDATVRTVTKGSEWEIVDAENDRVYSVKAVKVTLKKKGRSDSEKKAVLRIYNSGWRLLGGYELAILAMTLMFVSYGMAGGLGAAIITDFIQGILTIAFSFLLLPYVFLAISGDGGLQFGAEGALQMNSGLKQGMLDLYASAEVAAIVGGEPITIFYVFMLSLTALAGIVVQPHIMGVCGAGKTEFEGRFGFTYGNFIKRLCTMAWTFTGLACIVWYLGVNSPLKHTDAPQDQTSAEFQKLPEAKRTKIIKDRQTFQKLKSVTSKDFKKLPKAEQDQAKKIDKDFADKLFGRAAYEILPTIAPGLVGLLLAALLAAIMSTSDAQMVVSSGLFTENVYKRFLVKHKSQRHYLWVGRISGLVIVLLALMMQATFTDVIDALRVVLKTPAVLGISLWVGIVWRGWTPLAVWASAAACALVWAFTAYFPDQIAAASLTVGTRELNLHFLMNDKLTKVSDAWQMASFMTFGVLVGFLVSLISPRTRKEKLDHFFTLLRTPVRKGEHVETPCTLPDNPLPPVEKIFNYEDIELPKPTWVGFGGFVLAWILVGGIIGLTYYLAQIM